MINRLKQLYTSYKKVIENYFFMTILQVLNSFFYLLIYPYLIRSLGAHSYGIFVFATSFVLYFTTFISYGFDFPAAKEIARNVSNIKERSKVFSIVTTAKIYLLVPSTLVFLALLVFLPLLKDNKAVFIICYSQVLTPLFLCSWYFQGMERMKTITYTQLFFKLASLPLIFIYVNSPDDLWIFATITCSLAVLGGLVAFIQIIYKDRIELRILKPVNTFNFFREATPFFLSNASGIIKQQSTVLITGTLFSMSSVAVYDLANKIISIPIFLFNSITGALFPMVAREQNQLKIRKLIWLEVFLGVFSVIGVALLGRPFIIHFAGRELLAAYPLAIILSFTVISWLVVGAIISFIYVPKGIYKFVTQNQIVAFFTYFLFLFVGLAINKSIIVIAIAMAASGFCELLFNTIVLRVKKLF